MSILDRVAPGFAARRAAARVVTKELERISASGNPVGTQRSETRWRGASRVLRSLSNWLPTLGSGRSDLPREERRRIVARSYDAFRNHPIARAIITRRRTSVIGTGLICHPAVDAKTLGISEEQAQELNETIERRWRLWAENPSECDIEATLDFYCQQALVEVSAATAGECFALTPYVEKPGGLYGINVNMI
jgi:capsid protein